MQNAERRIKNGETESHFLHSAFCVLRSAFKYARNPSLHDSGRTPVSRSYRSVDKTEFAGRVAGRGKSSVDTGLTTTSAPSSLTIALANSCHVQSGSSA